MPLSWTEQDRIAQMLLEAYPDQDRLSLTLPQLQTMIAGLPGFAGPAQAPSETYLHKILWTWMRLANADIDLARAAGGES